MRYFFNVRNGHDISDAVGSEIADLAAVREEAVAARRNCTALYWLTHERSPFTDEGSGRAHPS